MTTTLEAFGWEYGWDIEYETDADLSQATGAAFVLTVPRQASLTVPATIADLGSGRWLLSHTVVAGTLPAAQYGITPQIDFGTSRRTALETHRLVIK